MSEQCKMKSMTLESLQPKWVEFTKTPGVLRCLKPSEDTSRAKGLIFLCPRCRLDKEKKHYCIFLFPDAPENSRPHGRFILDLLNHPSRLKEPWSKQTMYESPETGSAHMLLKPRDVCGWTGYLSAGKVSWRPSFLERLRMN